MTFFRKNMDKNDLICQNTLMAKNLESNRSRILDDPALIHALSRGLWQFRGHNLRSQELTPIFVQRFYGPRPGSQLNHHSFWEFTFFFRGTGYFQTQDRQIAFQKNVGILVPPRCPHVEVASESIDTLWIGLQGSALGIFPNRIIAASASEAAPYVEKLWLKAQSCTPPIGFELDGLTKTVMAMFYHAFDSKIDQGKDIIDTIIYYLHEHFLQNLTTDQLAAIAGLSPGYFFRAFRKRTGFSPKAYLNHLRLQHAVRLLQTTSLSIKQIAQMTGFTDQLYFSKLFRKHTGFAPRSFRQGLATHT